MTKFQFMELTHNFRVTLSHDKCNENSHVLPAHSEKINSNVYKTRDGPVVCFVLPIDGNQVSPCFLIELLSTSVDC